MIHVVPNALSRFTRKIWLYLGNWIVGFVERSLLYKTHYVPFLQNVAISSYMSQLFVSFVVTGWKVSIEFNDKNTSNLSFVAWWHVGYQNIYDWYKSKKIYKLKTT
jgi:hypothetical protein